MASNWNVKITSISLHFKMFLFSLAHYYKKIYLAASKSKTLKLFVQHITRFTIIAAPAIISSIITTTSTTRKGCV